MMVLAASSSTHNHCFTMMNASSPLLWNFDMVIRTRKASHEGSASDLGACDASQRMAQIRMPLRSRHSHFQPFGSGHGTVDSIIRRRRGKLVMGVKATRLIERINWAVKTRFVPCPTGLISWLSEDARLTLLLLDGHLLPVVL